MLISSPPPHSIFPEGFRTTAPVIVDRLVMGPSSEILHTSGGFGPAIRRHPAGGRGGFRLGPKRATDSVTSGGGTCSDSGHTRLAESITRTLEFR
jgi:hypothetical protein